MASLNRCMFIGNLGKDPEVRFTPGGQAVANFSIACSESWTKDGQKQERTEWVRVTAWGKTAELCGEYLKKGKQVFVEGKMQTREYEKDGQKRYATEIVASNVVFLGGRDGGQQAAGGGSSGYSQQAQQPVQRAVQAVNDTFGQTDEIPF